MQTRKTCIHKLYDHMNVQKNIIKYSTNKNDEKNMLNK